MKPTAPPVRAPAAAHQDCENENPGEGYERYQSVGNFADF